MVLVDEGSVETHVTASTKG